MYQQFKREATKIVPHHAKTNQPMDYHHVTMVELTSPPGGKFGDSFYTHCLIVIDNHTKFVWMRPLRINKSDTIIDKLLKLYCEFGSPKSISFCGNIFTDDCQEIADKLGNRLGVEIQLTTCSDIGDVHDTVCTLIAYLGISSNIGPKDFPLHQIRHNKQIQIGVGKSPYEMMFGRAPNQNRVIASNCVDTDKTVVQANQTVSSSVSTVRPKIDNHAASYAKLVENAGKENLQIEDNPGGGNCLFYSLSDQLTAHGVDKSDVEIRKDISEYMRTHKTITNEEGIDISLCDFLSTDLYPDWESYVDTLARDGEWGDHMALLAAVHCYQANIRVISNLSDVTQKIAPIDGSTVLRTLNLGQIGDEHYVSLIPK